MKMSSGRQLMGMLMMLRNTRHRRAALLGLILALCATARIGVAQEALPDSYKETGLNPNRDYVNQHVTEHIDPFAGSYPSAIDLDVCAPILTQRTIVRGGTLL
jgi:hypothetical protein